MSAIDQLASWCGIQDSYEDVFGNRRETSPEVTIALLNAMGFPVQSEQDATSALAALEDRARNQPLPPVVVARLDRGPICIPVTMESSDQELSWALLLESGEERTGVLVKSAGRLVSEHMLRGQRVEQRAFTLPGDIPTGYHQFRLTHGAASASPLEMPLIVSPGKCFLPELDQQGKLWGIAANLYLLKSARNWGFGDFTDLQTLVQLALHNGADALGLNPLHAMFLDKPEEASPYSPSDRTLLNVLNVDVEALPELAACAQARHLIASADFQQRLTGVRQAELVQYETVAELKLAVLRLLFEYFEEDPDPVRTDLFHSFHAERRELLDRACTFQALRAWFAGQTPAQLECHKWPEEYRSADAPGVAEFARSQAKLVRFHLWLQWIADSQLREAAEAAKPMTVGLYRDLAVGASPAGAEIWSHPRELVPGAQIGAPPDILAPEGQNWGLPPLHPLQTREHAYSSFIQLLRANMRYAGALRIDHAMALRRLYWIPSGNSAGDGAFVRYNMDDLIGIVALESQRNQCLVIGEDLGSVPEGFSEELAAANILSYRILFFEKDEYGFKAPAEYPRLSLAVASNHDLPTVQGWWQQRDIDLKERLGLYPEGSAKVRQERVRDRSNLATALREEGFVEAERLTDEQYFEGVHRLLGRTCSLFSLVPLEDILQQPDQVNLPGTTGEHPNWRRRLSAGLEELAAETRLQRLANWMREERLRRPSADHPRSPTSILS